MHNFKIFLGLPILYLMYDAFEVLVMIFLISCCMFLLEVHKRLSVWLFKNVKNPVFFIMEYTGL